MECLSVGVRECADGPNIAATCLLTSPWASARIRHEGLPKWLPKLAAVELCHGAHRYTSPLVEAGEGQDRLPGRCRQRPLNPGKGLPRGVPAYVAIQAQGEGPAPNHDPRNHPRP